MKSILDIQSEDLFYLSDNFLKKYKRKQPKWGPIGYVVFKRTYSRNILDKNNNPTGKSEEFWQTCQRVVETTYTIQKWHCRKNGLPFSANKAQYSAQTMFHLMWEFKFLPPGRGLWAMDIELLKKRLVGVVLNCAFISTEDIDMDFSYPFCFLMDTAMLGIGVGLDTDGAGKIKIKEPKISTDIHIIDDSREGWVELTKRILDAYVGKATLPEKIDYSNIRPHGEILKTMGGIAPGPEPLQKLVKTLHDLLQPMIDLPITSTIITDLANVIGVCVVSGNLRRTAEIVLGQPDDTDFLSLKDPKLYKDELKSHRWASNNSVYVSVGDDYKSLAKQTSLNGEPGFVWLNNARYRRRMKDKKDVSDCNVKGFNPCAEQQLENGELCLLCETFPVNHDTYEEYEKTLKYAYLYAKTVSLIPFHIPKSNAIMMKNRRIGLSQSGIIQSFQKHGRRAHFEWCDNGYNFVRQIDIKYSDWLAVPLSKRVTTVKPSGSVSLLPGATPGIHYEHAPFYYRTIRIGKESELIQILKEAGYRIEDASEDSNNTVVVYFPVKAAYFDRSKNEVSMWEQLENAAQMQYYWSDNSVSNTVTFKQHEAPHISKALELYETRLKTISFLPLKDHGYKQAPYIEINEKEYNKAIKDIKPLKIKENVHDQEEKFCDGDFCEIK